MPDLFTTRPGTRFHTSLPHYRTGHYRVSLNEKPEDHMVLYAAGPKEAAEEFLYRRGLLKPTVSMVRTGEKTITYSWEGFEVLVEVLP